MLTYLADVDIMESQTPRFLEAAAFPIVFLNISSSSSIVFS